MTNVKIFLQNLRSKILQFHATEEEMGQKKLKLGRNWGSTDQYWKSKKHWTRVIQTVPGLLHARNEQFRVAIANYEG